MSQTLADDSEVVFDQMEPKVSVPNRRKEETWSEATEPYRGARPRTMEFDQPVDGGLGATLGGVEGEETLRDAEQLIQQEEEVQTPPRREPRRNEGHQPRGPRVMTDESVVGLGHGIRKYRVSHAARSRRVTEGTRGTRTCAPGAASGTHDDKGTLV